MIIYDFSLALNANIYTIDKLGMEVNIHNLRIRCSTIWFMLIKNLRMNMVMR